MPLGGRAWGRHHDAGEGLRSGETIVTLPSSVLGVADLQS